MTQTQTAGIAAFGAPHVAVHDTRPSAEYLLAVEWLENASGKAKLYLQAVAGSDFEEGSEEETMGQFMRMMRWKNKFGCGDTESREARYTATPELFEEALSELEPICDYVISMLKRKTSTDIPDEYSDQRHGKTEKEIHMTKLWHEDREYQLIALGLWEAFSSSIGKLRTGYREIMDALTDPTFPADERNVIPDTRLYTLQPRHGDYTIWLTGLDSLFQQEKGGVVGDMGEAAPSSEALESESGGNLGPLLNEEEKGTLPNCKDTANKPFLI
ncbi:hypothetical protein PG990_003290 [Apiospora arundinis]